MTRSAEKAHRQSIKRRLRNRAVKSATKTAIKRATDSIASGDIDAAREAVRAALSTLDRAAQKGVIHPNNAGRRKSRLLLRYNASVAASATGGAPAAEAPARPARKAKAAAAPKATRKAASAKPKAAAKRPPAKKTKK